MDTPCRTCKYACYKDFPQTRFEPAEYDGNCDFDMKSFDSDEGCWQYERDWDKDF